MNTKLKSIFVRFLKGAISGAVTAMGLVTFAMPSVWTDFIGILNTLGIAGMAGAISGILMAAEKWANWTE